MGMVPLRRHSWSSEVAKSERKSAMSAALYIFSMAAGLFGMMAMRWFCSSASPVMNDPYEEDPFPRMRISTSRERSPGRSCSNSFPPSSFVMLVGMQMTGHFGSMGQPHSFCRAAFTLGFSFSVLTSSFGAADSVVTATFGMDVCLKLSSYYSEKPLFMKEGAPCGSLHVVSDNLIRICV